MIATRMSDVPTGGFLTWAWKFIRRFNQDLSFIANHTLNCRTMLQCSKFVLTPRKIMSNQTLYVDISSFFRQLRLLYVYQAFFFKGRQRSVWCVSFVQPVCVRCCLPVHWIACFGMFLQGFFDKKLGLKFLEVFFFVKLKWHICRRLQWILALLAPKEGSSSNVQKLKIGDTTNKESLSEHDLQGSGNEIGIGNTETSNGMKTSVNIENIPEFSPYFHSEYGMMGDTRKGIGDGIAAKTIILPLSGNEIITANITTNNEKKGVCGKKGDNLVENADEIAIGKIKSKRKSSLEEHKL
ncbi:hypothetical protein VNO80_09932 [Phaseolus coccineus]|uniref:Uncharacterized protein n=1 Tax=Phaseolus coccineus TaxID=3886 RepID=A0AAN9NCI0_PHACN